jgi:uncharacterized membrane protein required for colicin V production
MDAWIKSLQQLFSQPSFIAGVNLGQMIALILGVIVVSGAIMTIRMIGQITGCVLRVGCLLVGLFLFSAIVSVLMLSGVPK